MQRRRATAAHNVDIGGRWRFEALCAEEGASPQDFDDKITRAQYLQTVETFCSRCPVRHECYLEGTRVQGWGIWGGAYMNDGKVQPVPAALMPESVPQRAKGPRRRAS